MKYLLAIAVAASLLSCKKCYVCTTTVKLYNTWGTLYNTSTSESNFCGTAWQKTKHEKESSSTKPGTQQAKTVTEMSCVAE